MKLNGVHHVSLNVHDTQEVGRFYTKVLGLEELPRPDFGVPGMWLRAGGQEIHLIEVKDHRAPEGQHFAFAVEDLAESIEQLREMGVEVSDPRSLPGGARQSFLRDPAGNLIELNQQA
jgi:catechol 2,3-dioxygenase-like lactoylglutathione lyase family enzyme